MQQHSVCLLTCGFLLTLETCVSDSNCVKMLDLGVVPHILTMLEQHVDKGDVSVQHAGLSALRNLAIPGRTEATRVGAQGDSGDSSSQPFCVSATNKVRMLEEGVSDRIKALLRSNMPPVQFKLLGTLRMMVDGQGRRQSTNLVPVADVDTPTPACGTAEFNSGSAWSRGSALHCRLRSSRMLPSVTHPSLVMLSGLMTC